MSTMESGASSGSSHRQSIGFAAEHETRIDTVCGVTMTRAYETAGGLTMPPRVLHYDAYQVIGTTASWRALLKETYSMTALYLSLIHI